MEQSERQTSRQQVVRPTLRSTCSNTVPAHVWKRARSILNIKILKGTNIKMGTY